MPKLKPLPLCRRRLLAASLLLLALPFPLAAGVGVWTPVGPDGGTVSALAVHPRQPATVYAGTFVNGLFRSMDAGRSWKGTADGPGPGIAIQAIQIDPLRPQTVFAVADHLVYKSTDGGRNWTPRRIMPDGAAFLRSLAIDPGNPNRLYLGSTSGLFRSQNGGGAWRKVDDSRYFHDLLVEPGSGWIFAATYTGLQVSRDGGARWERLAGGLPPSNPFHRLLRATQRGRASLYAAFEASLYRSDDRGQSWVRVGAASLTSRIFHLAFDERRGLLYAGTMGQGVLVSGDRGASWRPAPAILGNPDISAVAAVPGAVYAGTYTHLRPGGLFKSTDGGASWQPSQKGLSALSVDALAASPRVPGLLFASALQAGFYRSRDFGRSWQLVGGLPKPVQVLDIAFDPHAAAAYAVSEYHETATGITYRWLLKSTDDGDSWQVVDLGHRLLTGVWVDLGRPATLWGVGSDLSRSDDRGATWSTPTVDVDSAGLGLSAVRGDGDHPSVLYAPGSRITGGGGFGPPPTSEVRLYRSTDGGGSWQRKDAGLSGTYALQLALDSGDTARLYTTTDKGLFRSRDRGESWERMPLPGSATAVLAPPASPGTAYAAVAGGVFRTADGGETWSRIDTGLGRRSVWALVADPHAPRTIYAATGNGGVFSYQAP